MIVSVQRFVGMGVNCLFLPMDVGMLMRVFVFVGMNEIVMAVRMVVDMGMLVGML